MFTDSVHRGGAAFDAGEARVSGGLWSTITPHLRVRHTRSPAPRVDAWVLDPQFRQALATVRSLGAAGRYVGTACCLPQARWAPAAASRWCGANAVLPDFTVAPENYVAALLHLLDEHPARVLIPGHDGSIATIRAHRAEFEKRTVVALASEEALAIAGDKVRTLEIAKRLGIAVPRSVLVHDTSEVKAAVEHLDCPVVVKPTSSWATSGSVGTRLFSMGARSLDEATRKVDRIVASGGSALLQEWLPGRRDAVSLFVAKGEVTARFAQSSRREYPPLGGSSVFCESLPLQLDIVAPAEKLVREIGAEGYSMVEFRRDRKGLPILMEVNARMAGSVQLARSCGVDFPAMTYAWALGEPLPAARAYPVGRRLRWLGGEARALRVIFRDHGQLDVPARGAALAAAIGDFFLRPSRMDVIDLRDPRPAIVEAGYMLDGAVRVLFGAEVPGEAEGTAA